MNSQYAFDAIRLIVFDIDGTLLDSRHELQERTISTLRKCRQKGVPYTFATGKNWDTAQVLAEKLEIHIPLILANGAIISDPQGIPLESFTIPADAVKMITEICDRYGRDLIVCNNEKYYIKEHTYNLDLLYEYGQPNFEPIGGWDKIGDDLSGTYKCDIIDRDDPRKLFEIEEIIRRKVNQPLAYCHSLPVELEIMADGVSKGNAIRRLCKRLDIDPSAVIVFGDGNNDIEMLQLDGLGVSLANGSHLAKASSNLIVPSNDRSGPAQLLEYILEMRDKIRN